jgi:hypothetical protein
MIEIDVRNFQSIEHAKLKIDGFTALVGRSNIGKSAFVRAVRSALTGAPIANSIRHAPSCERRLKNAKSCSCVSSVRIKAQGFNLFREKGDAVNRYILNGVVYDKVEQGTPDFLLAKFAPIKIGEGKELLQVSDQFSPIFLLDQSGTVVADVLSDVAHLDCINVAMREAERDRKEAVATRKVREKDLAVLSKRLGSFAGLDGVIAEAYSIEDIRDRLVLAQGGVLQLGSYIKALGIFDSSLDCLTRACQKDPPDAGFLLDQARLTEKVRRFWARLSERASSVKALLGVDNITDLESISANPTVQMFGRVHAWANALFELQVWFESRKPLLNLVEPPLKDFVDACRKQTQKVQYAEHTALLGRASAVLEAEVARSDKEITSILHEFQDLGICPTCTKEIHYGDHV